MTAKKLDNFHDSRVVWAIYNGKMYFALSEKGHKKWFMDKLNIPESEFENIKRGYIRRSNKDWDVLNVVAYRGSNFEQVELTDEETAKLLWMTDLIHDCEKMRLYSGVKVGDVGEVWEPLTLIKSVDSAEVDYDHKKVSLKSLVEYEDALVNFLDYHDIDDSITALVTWERDVILSCIDEYIEKRGDIELTHNTDRAVGYKIK